MIRYFFILFVMLLVFIPGCGDDNNHICECVLPGWTFDEFVHFNTGEYMYMRSSFPASVPCDVVLNWEESFGEPFTDMNGNGVYDEGTDSFFIDWDSPDNQDLDYDSLYTGTDPADWSPGIPFDDIDGNGYLRNPNAPGSNSYSTGVPFADYNMDGQYNGTSGSEYNISKWSKSDSADGTWYNLGTDAKIDNALWRYVSDSGIVYEFPFRVSHFTENFCLTAGGLTYYDYTYIMDVLDRGTLTEVDTAIEVIDRVNGGTVSAQKYIDIDTCMTIGDTTYTNLVLVRLTVPDFEYKFLFSRNMGLLYNARIYLNGPSGYMRFYNRRIPGSDPLIFPMTRIEP